MASGVGLIGVPEIALMLDMQKAPTVKQYLVYDVDANVTDIYYAQAAAADGEACIRQKLEYTTIGGNKYVQKISWIDATWSNTYDI